LLRVNALEGMDTARSAKFNIDASHKFS